MKEELETMLFDKFDDLFRERTLPATESSMHWGIQCGDGWFNLILDLCVEIQRISPDAKITEVKQKAGALVVRVDIDNEVIDQLVEEARSNSLRTCEICGDSGKPNDKLWADTRCAKHAST